MNPTALHATTARRTSLRPGSSRPAISRVALPAALLALTGALAACGSDAGTTAGDTTGDTAGAGQGAPAAPGGDAMAIPGAAGTIAAIDGRTMQVQSETTGQVAVSITGDTAITDQVAAALSDVEVGSCVVVRPAGTGDATAAEEPSTEVVAATVAISAADEGGTCAAGFGGPGGPGGSGGEPPSDMPTDMPTDMPSDLPERGDGGTGGFGGFGTTGTVTDVSSDGFVVEAIRPAGDDAGAATEVTVSTTKDTTYAREVDGDDDSLRVGRCVLATGESDQTGAISAESVTVSDALDGTCPAGGLRGGFGGGAGAEQGEGAS